jgi:hypothetical protein
MITYDWSLSTYSTYTVQSGGAHWGKNSGRTALYHLSDSARCVPQGNRLKIAPVSLFIVFRVDDHHWTLVAQPSRPTITQFLKQATVEVPQAGKAAASEIHHLASRPLMSHEPLEVILMPRLVPVG